MDVSFLPVAEKCEMQIHSNYSSARVNRTTPSTGYIGKRSFILSLYEEERSLENRSYDVSILGSGMTSYIFLLRNSTNNTTQAT